MTTETLPIPRQPTAAHLPLPGEYGTGADRCIAELAATVGGLTTYRRRLACAAGRLTVADGPAGSVLRVEAGGRYGAVAFESAAITPAAGGRLAVAGDLRLRDGALRAVLDARVTRREDHRLTLLGLAWLDYGLVREVCGLRLPRLVPCEDVRLLIAADFS